MNKRGILRLSFFFIISVSAACVLWAAILNIPAFLFLNYLQQKQHVQVHGHKQLSFFSPKIIVRDASFSWDDKVALVNGNLELTVETAEWFRNHVWAFSLNGDGAHLQFLGDWLRKTGVKDVHATQLRLAVDFDRDGIRDIHTVQLLSPDYQFQVQSRVEKKS